ncbi:DUF3710 domain-containing protein [Brevibacterium sp. 50QC2O2]|uniref:DUF3710 domain-containing protein n=1 Tax=Brevibacterium TaxID=1696 RepID=UPI00211C019B|nr:DUF3710 domain-containing protein [Brevibacterium sp. 91QC2O2]MCQ9384138.1 DUF3710 domain-containing protein [Brevibacterium sp. 68QC2CO]MCQ9388384.1 DUF3710 domain-containing protein [Brevibacterium sp. 50QC2O2]
MGLFDRFRKKHEESQEPSNAAAGAQEADDTAGSSEPVPAEQETPAEDEEFAKQAPRDRSENGPWDAAEDALDGNRIDLGALRIPVVDGLQFQLETAEDEQTIMAASVVYGEGKMQLQAFAAPKTEGLWGEVRASLIEGITASGGKAREAFGEHGYEIVAGVPVADRSGRAHLHPARFLGVDGPRWFLRAVLTDAAATDDEAAELFLKIFRGTIVERGDQAMPPREVLLLSAPRVDDGEGEVQDADEDPNPFARGPEIAEVR